MIRFVVGPDAVVVPDLRRKLPGRGVWVTARADKVGEAVRRQAFSRSFKTKVEASTELPMQIEALLIQDCLQALSLANKAGQVVLGFAKVEAAVAAGGVAGLVHAQDAGADGRRKLTQALRRRFQGETRPQVDLFESAQLDLALGRTNVIHAGLMAGMASEAFLSRCRRLALYRSAPQKDADLDLDGEPGLHEAAEASVQP